MIACTVRPRHDRGTHLGIGREKPKDADQMQPQSRRPARAATEECLPRRHHPHRDVAAVIHSGGGGGLGGLGFLTLSLQHVEPQQWVPAGQNLSLFGGHRSAKAGPASNEKSSPAKAIDCLNM